MTPDVQMSEINEPISVVLATCNGEKYLVEMLESLATQMLLPSELVVGDDGSTDGTLRIPARFAGRSPFPVSVAARPARVGYADNFLATEAWATGSLFAFCDQDDIWAPKKLETVATAFANYPDAVLVARHAEVVDSNGRSLNRIVPALSLTGSPPVGELPLTHSPGFALTIRRQLLEVADPSKRLDQGDERAGLMNHDSWLWILASCTGSSVVLAPCLVSYRQHQNLFGDLHVGWAERLRRARDTHVDTYGGRASAGRLLAEYLEGLGAEWSRQHRPEWVEHAASRAEQHHSRAAFATRRDSLCAAPGRREAFGRGTRMLRSGVYLQQDGFRVASVAKDGLRSV